MSGNPLKVNDISWMIGGAQGSGVDSSANVFSRALAHGGLNLYGKREYYSNIKGEHSYFTVRAVPGVVRAHVDDVNVLATFDAETAFRHAGEVTEDGALIYDPGLGRTKISDIPTIGAGEKTQLKTYLIARGLGETLEDIVASAKQRGVRILPIPFNDILEEVADEFKVDQISKIARMVNMFAVGASLGLLHFPLSYLEKALGDVFRSKASVVKMNLEGARKAAERSRSLVPDFRYRLETVPRKEPRLFLAGSQAGALGKVLGGLRFQTYYPITPASDESEFLEENEVLDRNGHDPEASDAAFAKATDGSVLVVQTEDEISAITMAIGAALTGARSATATSGPGFCLMMEGIGYASINEVPVVITLYQRAGPSTGMPTRHEQGDLRFALHAGHGESPRILLASGDFEEMILDGALAFNLAERYQMPVIHLVDKALANSNATIDLPDFAGIRIDRGSLLQDGTTFGPDSPYRRFDMSKGPVSPRAVLGQAGTIFWNTGDEHDETGHITEDPSLRDRMMEERQAKLDLCAEETPEGVK